MQKKFCQFKKRLYLCIVNLRNKTPTTIENIIKEIKRCGRLERFGASVVGASMTGNALFVSLFKSYHNEKFSFNS